MLIAGMERYFRCVMRLIRDSAFLRIFWGLMALYLLNISVDTADPDPEHIPEDLSFNEQESLVEIVVEKLMGFESAIAEYDDHDSEEHNKKNSKIEIVLACSGSVDEHGYPSLEGKSLNSLHSFGLTTGHHRLESPPPKA